MAVSGSLQISGPAKPKTPHVSDGNVQPFLQADFDPADYLNNAIPPLSLSSSKNTASATYGRSATLPELSIQLQTLVSQLNAQTSRLSNALTQLTDEIIRSGSRLAYEVEVLRGETTGLTDSLENGLKNDVAVFTTSGHSQRTAAVETNVNTTSQEGQDVGGESTELAYLERLKTLTAVRSRLDSVIKVFGEAMQWPIAPSELSATSSLISVSAPETGEDSRSREEKGKAYSEKLRNEINDLIGTGKDVDSLEAAAARVEELRQLAGVWKGTAEEKARMKLVESLHRPVEERQRALGRMTGARKPTISPSRGVDYRYGNADPTHAPNDSGYGFLQNLRNMKNEVYLE